MNEYVFYIIVIVSIIISHLLVMGMITIIANTFNKIKKHHVKKMNEKQKLQDNKQTA